MKKILLKSLSFRAYSFVILDLIEDPGFLWIPVSPSVSLRVNAGMTHSASSGQAGKFSIRWRSLEQ